MRKLLIALAASAAFAAPASAQGPVPGPEADARIVESLPSGEEIEAFAPAIDRSVDAMLDVDVGPMMDAVDPFARRPGYGRPGRTLRRMGRARDPYFDQRVRGSIYGTTAEFSRMMNAFAVAAPAMRRSLFEMQRSIAAAVDDYHRGRARYDRRGPRYEDDGPRFDEGRPPYDGDEPLYDEPEPLYDEAEPPYTADEVEPERD